MRIYGTLISHTVCVIRLFVSVNVILSFFLILQRSINLFLLGILTCNLQFKNSGPGLDPGPWISECLIHSAVSLSTELL